MPTNFLSLPSELRNNIYEQLLLLEEPIMCMRRRWLEHDNFIAFTPGLLLVNKMVHREASSLLYAHNRFDFTLCTSGNVASFLDQIGRDNADHIREISIDFPEFSYLDLNNVTLEDDSALILAKIRDNCNQVGTLTTSRYSTDAMELKLDALDHPKVVSEAIALVNARFRTISSVQNIIVEVYEEGPSGQIRKEMESHGWMIRATERVQTPWTDGGDYESDYVRFDDSYSEDDYDIDNDSDFWRRAGD